MDRTNVQIKVIFGALYMYISVASEDLVSLKNRQAM